MANAQVEKLKVLGMQHGEKAAVAITGAVCLLLLFKAATRETIATTPAEVADSAKRAQTNLSRTESRGDILTNLEGAGFKNPDYEKVVEAQAKTKIDPLAFKSSRPWIIPEPGAGLIRGQPTLVAVEELEAFPGRGGFLVFELDENGKRVPDPDANKVDEAVKKRRGRKKRRGGMMAMMGSSSGMSGGMGGGMPGMMGGNPDDDSPEAKKARERADRQLKKSLAGKAKPDADKGKEKGKEDASPTGAEPPSKEVAKGFRWVSITGTLNHKKMKDNWAAALKRDAAAPNYKQLNVQSQYLGPDDKWSDWEDVDNEKNHAISYNLPEEEEELTTESARINTLVDPLPFLKAGFWQGVHVVSLVPKEKLETKTPATMAGGMMGSSGMMDSSMMSMPGMKGGAGMMSSGMMGSGMMGSGMMGDMMGGGGAEESQDFQKSDADTIMVRSLDFTVEPDTTYRFRVQVVVFNPNYKRDDVAPGTETQKMELTGPWSDASNAVTMPPDISAYAMKKTPTGQGARRADKVNFQIVKWNPEDGVTVTKLQDYGPGDVIGEQFSMPIPRSDGKKMENKNVDLNSRELLVDTAGGLEPIAPVGAAGAPLDVPALSMLLRTDGSLMVRNEVYDLPDPVRKDIEENYKREVKEAGSGKARESSLGSSSMSGAMGMYRGSRR